MKKLFFALTAFILTGTAYAQFNIGIKAVANASSIKTKTDGTPYDAKFGFAGGAYAEYYLSRQIGLAAELLYNEKGAKQTSAETDVKTNLNYLSIPILFYFEPIRNLKLGLGPELAFLLSAKAKGDSINTTDIKKYFQSFDKAVAFGGSYSFGRLGITGRYVAGLNGTFNNPEAGEEAVKQTIRNNVFQLAISFRLNKGQEKDAPAKQSE